MIRTLLYAHLSRRTNERSTLEHIRRNIQCFSTLRPVEEINIGPIDHISCTTEASLAVGRMKKLPRIAYVHIQGLHTWHSIRDCLPSWKAKILKTTNRRINTRKIRQHGISKRNDPIRGENNQRALTCTKAAPFETLFRWLVGHGTIRRNGRLHSCTLFLFF